MHCILHYIHLVTSCAHSIANHSIASKSCLKPMAHALYSLDHITRPQLCILQHDSNVTFHTHSLAYCTTSITGCVILSWHHTMHHNLEALHFTHRLIYVTASAPITVHCIASPHINTPHLTRSYLGHHAF